MMCSIGVDQQTEFNPVSFSIFLSTTGDPDKRDRHARLFTVVTRRVEMNGSGRTVYLTMKTQTDQSRWIEASKICASIPKSWKQDFIWI